MCLTLLVPLLPVCEHKDLGASYKASEEEKGGSPQEGEIRYIVMESKDWDKDKMEEFNGER